MLYNPFSLFFGILGKPKGKKGF